MAKKLEEKQLFNLIKRREYGKNYTIIHIYDYGRKENVLDIDIEPYRRNKIEYFEMAKDEDVYQRLYEKIKTVSPGHIREIPTGGRILEPTLQFFIKKVWIIIEYYTEDGREFLQNIYDAKTCK